MGRKKSLAWLRPRRKWHVYGYTHEDISRVCEMEEEQIHRDINRCIRYCRKAVKKLDRKTSPLTNVLLLMLSLLLTSAALGVRYLILGQVGEPMAALLICFVVSSIVVFGVSRLFFRRMEYKFLEKRIRLKIYRHARIWDGYMDDGFIPYYQTKREFDEIEEGVEDKKEDVIITEDSDLGPGPNIISYDDLEIEEEIKAGNELDLRMDSELGVNFDPDLFDDEYERGFTDESDDIPEETPKKLPKEELEDGYENEKLDVDRFLKLLENAFEQS